MAKKWIQKALSKKGSHGALHRALGIPEGHKIGAARIAAAAKRGGKVGREARLAQTLGRMRRK